MSWGAYAREVNGIGWTSRINLVSEALAFMQRKDEGGQRFSPSAAQWVRGQA